MIDLTDLQAALADPELVAAGQALDENGINTVASRLAELTAQLNTTRDNPEAGAQEVVNLTAQMIAAAAAGPVGWAVVFGAMAASLWKRGGDTAGALVWWPQDDVADGYRRSAGEAIATFLPPLPSTPGRGVPELPARIIANEVIAAIKNGRPGVATAVRQAAFRAAGLVGAGASAYRSGPFGQTWAISAPMTVRQVWQGRYFTGVRVARKEAYLLQMLTRVPEWAPLVGWQLIDPALVSQRLTAPARVTPPLVAIPVEPAVTDPAPASLTPTLTPLLGAGAAIGTAALLLLLFL